MIVTISKIIIKEGITTPIVETIAPNSPACLVPMKVAILMANEPGVDSQIAIKSINSLDVSQLLFMAISWMMDIIPYPPPKDIVPINKKFKNNFK